MYLSQSRVVWSENERKYRIICRLIPSAFELLFGWYGVVLTLVMPSKVANCDSTEFRNSRPLSEQRKIGAECRHIHRRKKASATTSADLSLIGHISAYFEKRSVMTQM